MRRETLRASDREPKRLRVRSTAIDAASEATNDRKATTTTTTNSEPSLAAKQPGNSATDGISPAQIMRMQSTHGNRAVLRMLGKAPAPHSASLRVQRHDSFEHRLLGDARPEDLNTVASNISPEQREHVLTTERERLQIWQRNPRAVTAAEVQSTWPDARVLTLKNGLVVTYGELNTLGDYMPNPDAFDSGDVSVILPILQMVREQGFNQITDLLGVTREELIPDAMGGGMTHDVPDHQHFKGSIGPDGDTGTLASIKLVRALNEDTSHSGTNQYQSLVARNACHFAPYSWSRWQEFHMQARDLAVRGKNENNQELIRQAWITNGYADHFLQDSFAAGHLINKTLIMQWFVEWVKDHNAHTHWYQRNIHLDNWDQVQHMTTTEQPGLAGRGLYNQPFTAGSGGTADPQTAEEQGTRQQRMDTAGVQAGGGKTQDQEYQNYLAFLNNSVIQSAAGALHDYFNERSLWVGSVAHPQAYQIWGDDTMVASGEGVRIAGETAHMSQQVIDELTRTGNTSITAQQIRDRFPSKVRAEGSAEMVPLEQWNNSLRTLCNHTIFPNVHYRILSTVGATMGHVSKDAH